MVRSTEAEIIQTITPKNVEISVMEVLLEEKGWEYCHPEC